MNENFVTVDVNGKLINIDEDHLKINDLVVIQTGDILPADLKLVEVKGLEIDEFEITGEVLPVVKDINEDSITYKGSRVIRGTGKGFVVAISEQTEYGRILKQELELNLPQKLPIIDKKYFWLILLYLPVVIIFYIRSNDPVIMIILFLLFTLILNILQNDKLYERLLISRESKELERDHIHINDVKALEKMEDINFMCFDKTGVLTKRDMDINNLYFADRIMKEARRIHELEESTVRLVNIVCALCNDVLYFEKAKQANPIDKALISFAQKNGTNIHNMLLQYQRIYDEPFDSEKRYMACGFITSDKKRYYFAKGDPEIIFKMCKKYHASTSKIKKIDYESWWEIKSSVDAIIHNGDTAIALAYKSGDSSGESLNEYTFLCLLQLKNLLRPGTKTIIRKISEKGIRILLLTGDKAETAAKIGKESGITSDLKTFLTGRVIERLDGMEIVKQASYCSVFARLTPSQKGLLIIQLQQSGKSVAMVGDGLNDGIALKVADVGISFVKNSSPIARRFSKILINDLSDLLSLIEGANRIKRRAKYIKIFRILIIALSLLGVYICIFTGHYFFT